MAAIGNYIITVGRTTGRNEKMRETSKDQAIATARTYSLLDGVGGVSVDKTDGTHVAYYVKNEPR